MVHQSDQFGQMRTNGGLLRTNGTRMRTYGTPMGTDATLCGPMKEKTISED